MIYRAVTHTFAPGFRRAYTVRIIAVSAWIAVVAILLLGVLDHLAGYRVLESDKYSS